ncbi:MAG: TIGR03915 family putative DNA repair protein [Bacillota bacterium]|nr:TIGR03915 family putative DNA repair protein [Bacillota bacterium]
MTYVYDGSFEGLLTAVFDAWNDKNGLIYREGGTVPGLLDLCTVSTDSFKSDRVEDGIKKKLTNGVLGDIYLIYLSDHPEHANIVLSYLRFAFSQGRGVRSMLYESVVKDALTLRRKVTRETDRMLGLIRFDKTINDVYVAEIEPDHNILELIAHHFAHRLPNQDFVIRDLRRELAMCCRNGKWVITDLSDSFKFDFAQDNFREMWKEYFAAMAIKERVNPRLQKRCMPVRYWAHMPETEDIIRK